jgi:PIN domain nuclease of toxin-antitoxin system
VKAVLDASALLAYHGLSLGDRACLSLGLRLEVPVMTTDQVWASLDLSIAVHVVR